jgi:SAM-dependent methyltransferase
MRSEDRRRMRANRQMWDETVPLHMRSALYDVPSFRKGRNTLHPLEIASLRPVSGRSLLHLQCHFGLDTLSWARLGAEVTGVDFSGPAIRAARRLSKETGVPARFIRSNIYDLPDRLRGRFDIVYTAKGAVWWLPDLPRWARVVARFLKPGGRFFLLEDHPISDILRVVGKTRGVMPRFPYFTPRPQRDVSQGTYAAPEARLKHHLSYGWVHPISEFPNALIEAGLELRYLREYPYTYWRKFPSMLPTREGWWRLSQGSGRFPLMFSLLAVRPE